MADEPQGIRRIVVGLDGSKPSAAALTWAMAMSRGMGAEIVAVHAIDFPTDLSFGFGPAVAAAQFDPALRADVRRALEDDWCAPLKAAGLKHRTVLEDGRPATVITAVADAEGADVIVLGRRGHGGIAELVLGSVSHEVAQQSKRPVLLI